MQITYDPYIESLIFECVCPRCLHLMVKKICPDDVFYGFEVRCKHPACKKRGERDGYTFYFEPRLDGRMLGLSDRPLHEVELIDYAKARGDD
jgi:hypothetical protein